MPIWNIGSLRIIVCEELNPNDGDSLPSDGLLPYRVEFHGCFDLCNIYEEAFIRNHIANQRQVREMLGGQQQGASFGNCFECTYRTHSTSTSLRSDFIFHYQRDRDYHGFRLRSRTAIPSGYEYHIIAIHSRL
ncbi:hypothetical protein NLI96_g10975 [Meripilus lineatus]|uniref:Uncharacterized protein n=1 Tax=Meripilus lineatus TaxID=2056292 RepID=A0AAD5USY5_9APHY|nr:hypothetical protein NLI96_g10975 [Physisporinus lineatus]